MSKAIHNNKSKAPIAVKGDPSCANSNEANISPNLQIRGEVTNSEKRTNVKGDKRIRQWFASHLFYTDKHKKSDLVRFLLKCPLATPPKKLSIHNTNITKNTLTLMLKTKENRICLNLTKVEKGFMIKTGSQPAWIFNSSGKLVDRTEHKKVKVWLHKQGIKLDNKNKTDLEIFVSSCPICNTDKPLRFHRVSDDKLDLQCGCISYFRLLKYKENFIFTYRSKILKTFDNTGAEMSLS